MQGLILESKLCRNRSRYGNKALTTSKGFLALSLAPHFKHTLALDPAKKMVDIGLQPADSTVPKVEYKVGTAEKLGKAGVGEGEEGVDLVVAGKSGKPFVQSLPCLRKYGREDLYVFG